MVFICPAFSFLDCTGGGGGMTDTVATGLTKRKTGEVFLFSFLNSLESERQKEILETGKGFSPERMYTEKLRASVESQLLKLLLNGSFFLKVNFELWQDVLQFMQTNCEFQSRLTWSQLSGNQGSLCLFLLLPVKRWTGKSTRDMLYFSFCKIMTLFVIAAFFRGNFKHTFIHKQDTSKCDLQQSRLGISCPL